MDNNNLTKRQKDFYDYVVSYKKQHNIWPTYRDIQNNFSYKSPNSVTQNIKSLINKGYLGQLDNGEYLLTQKGFKSEITGWENAFSTLPNDSSDDIYLTYFHSHGYSICDFKDGVFYYQGTHDPAYVDFWLTLPDHPHEL